MFLGWQGLSSEKPVLHNNPMSWSAIDKVKYMSKQTITLVVEVQEELTAAKLYNEANNVLGLKTYGFLHKRVKIKFRFHYLRPIDHL